MTERPAPPRTVVEAVDQAMAIAGRWRVGEAPDPQLGHASTPSTLDGLFGTHTKVDTRRAVVRVRPKAMATAGTIVGRDGRTYYFDGTRAVRVLSKANERAARKQLARDRRRREAAARHGA